MATITKPTREAMTALVEVIREELEELNDDSVECKCCGSKRYAKFDEHRLTQDLMGLTEKIHALLDKYQ